MLFFRHTCNSPILNLCFERHGDICKIFDLNMRSSLLEKASDSYNVALKWRQAPSGQKALPTILGMIPRYKDKNLSLTERGRSTSDPLAWPSSAWPPALPFTPSCGFVASNSTCVFVIERCWDGEQLHLGTLRLAMACSCVAFSSTLPEISPSQSTWKLGETLLYFTWKVEEKSTFITRR